MLRCTTKEPTPKTIHDVEAAERDDVVPCHYCGSDCVEPYPDGPVWCNEACREADAEAEAEDALADLLADRPSHETTP